VGFRVGRVGGGFGCMKCGVVGEGSGSRYRSFVFLCRYCLCWVVYVLGRICKVFDCLLVCMLLVWKLFGVGCVRLVV